MLLPEKVGFPLCFPVIKRPCFERQVRKTRRYTNVVGCAVKMLHSELFPGGRCAVHLVGLYRQILQMVMEWCFFLLIARFTFSTV